MKDASTQYKTKDCKITTSTKVIGSEVNQHLKVHLGHKILSPVQNLNLVLSLSLVLRLVLILSLVLVLSLSWLVVLGLTPF